MIMAEETKKVGAKKPVAKKEPAVTRKEFNELSEMIGGLVNLVTPIVKANAEAKANTPETPLEKEVTKARPDPRESVNPEWEGIAKDIIGEALDRCEVKHLRSGGLLFTVVIKKEFSNAPDNYLAEMKEDRRTKEIGAEGVGGVENWCKLVKQNLARAKVKQITN